MLEKQTHAIIGAVAGFFCLLGVSLMLLTLGKVELGSILLAIIPIVGLVLGAVWGKLAPIGHPPR